MSSRLSARIWLLLTIIFCTFALSQAQAPQLPWPDPRNFDIYDDALHWDAIEHASGYRIRRLGISERDMIEVEVSQNRFDLSELRYDYTYFAQIQAISGDPTQYADSGYSSIFYLIRSFPTATPTSTATATPSPTPTRIFLQGISTPQNLRPLSGAKVAWDPVVGAVSYSVFISGGGEIHGASVFAPQTELTLTGLAAGVTYSVQVSAQGDGQNYELQGRWSKHINVTIPRDATETPDCNEQQHSDAKTDRHSHLHTNVNEHPQPHADTGGHSYRHPAPNTYGDEHANSDKQPNTHTD